MSMRTKCNEAGCDICSRGTLVGGASEEEKTYYCKKSKKVHKRKSAKECRDFRCNAPNEYSCKTCRGGKDKRH